MPTQRGESPFPGDPGQQEWARRWAEGAPRAMPQPPDVLSAPVLYLDQKIWVALLRGGGPALELSARLRDAVDGGRATVALSSANYIETWHRGEWTSRWALARLMWDTSRLVALPPMHALLRGEIADALRRFEVPADGAHGGEVDLGQGVNFAYGSPTGRMIHVGADGAQVPSEQIPGVWRGLQEQGGAAYEWFSLAGLPHDMRADGVDLTNNRRAGERFAEHESWLARQLGRRAGAARERPLIVDALRSIEEELAAGCEAAGVDARDFLLRLLDGDMDRGRQFLEAMLAFGTYHRLRALRHENPQKAWEGNDRLDMLALAVALTSCEMVVTERYWCHLARRAGCTGGGAARVHHSLRDALDDLEAAS